MSAHNHPTRVEGCFRCEMSRDELNQLGRSRWRSVDEELIRRQNEIDRLTAERDALQAKVDAVEVVAQMFDTDTMTMDAEPHVAEAIRRALGEPKEGKQ